MSEIADLQATDRAVPLPAELRRQAFAMFMDLPEDVAVLPAAEKPQPVSKHLSSSAFATLMAPSHSVNRDPGVAPIATKGSSRRPMILWLVAASLAVAIPATGLVVIAQFRPPRITQLPALFGLGPVYEERSDDGGRSLRYSVETRPPVEKRADPRVKGPSGQDNPPPDTVPDVTKTHPPRRPPPPPVQKDLVTTVLDQVKQVTELASDIVSAVVPLGGAEQKSPPILGPSG